ncbi:MAG: hypothetical protein SOZ07_06990 [Prevotella sp.]|nr:hypothetical protein [Prevotellaceae bacterium]MDY3936384.1 hypothetical protein [Prevotella sp.]MDY4218362.1 hypothetical protein [Prevotella sp.]
MIEIFTKEDLKPSKRTLDIIRQFAYTCAAIKAKGRIINYQLN